MMSMIDLEYDWEAERRARLAHRRRMLFAKWLWAVVWAVMIVGFIASIALLVWNGINRERFERAAYNEGRYGVDRATALAMADNGIGKCARELIDDYRAVRPECGPYHVADGRARTPAAPLLGEVR